MSRTAANLLLLLAGAVWGMGFVAQETAMEDLGPFGFIGLRFLVAGLAVLPFAIREMRHANKPVSVLMSPSFTLVGTVFFAAMALQQVGLLGTTVTNAGFLTALYVVFTPLILLLVLGEQQPAIIWPASLMSLIGIYLLSDGGLSGITWGDWLVILCAVFWALHVILIGKVGAKFKLPVAMACFQFFLCGIYGLLFHMIGPAIGIAEPAFNAATVVGAAPEILYAGIFAGGLAFTLQAVGQRYTSTSAAAILLSTESLFAAIFGAAFLSERLTSIGYLGAALIFIAIILVELAPRRKRIEPA